MILLLSGLSGFLKDNSKSALKPSLCNLEKSTVKLKTTTKCKGVCIALLFILDIFLKKNIGHYILAYFFFYNLNERVRNVQLSH